MGFFSDLKEDLSQAVNELMPEEQLDAALAENMPEEKLTEENADTLAFEGAMSLEEEMQSPKEPEKMEGFDSIDLSSMLDQLDESIPGEEAQMDEVRTLVEEAVPETGYEETVVEPVNEPIVTAEEKAIDQYYSKEENKKMDVQTRTVSDETAVVTAGMIITGDIVSEGSLELIGSVNGNIDILGKLNVTGGINGNSKASEIYAENAKITGEINSQGSVKIGQSSVVIGNISATSAVIAGAVKGDIDVKGPVILDTSAIVMGNIKSKSVQINNGAVIEGMCSQCYAEVNPTSFFEDFKKKK